MRRGTKALVGIAVVALMAFFFAPVVPLHRLCLGALVSPSMALLHSYGLEYVPLHGWVGFPPFLPYSGIVCL